MECTCKYRVKKLGSFWHLQRLYRKGWWIFKKRIWQTEFPWYSMDKKSIDKEYERRIKLNEYL